MTKAKRAIPLTVTKDILIQAYELMCQTKAMNKIYEENRQITTYVHSTSRGHEAIQLAAGFLLESYDYAAPYYRDEAMLLAFGMRPYELMLQLLAKRDDPFSGGRSYYSHPSLKRGSMPKIPHQSSATGMQAIPATGMAHGVKYKEQTNQLEDGKLPIVLCSLGDGCVTEGEVSEAMQMAVLKELPIIYLVQDNDWGISATGAEMRAMDAYEFAAGFKGLKRMRTNGSDFVQCYEDMKTAVNWVRKTRKPLLIHASVPLLGHHTSGVRSEWYRDDWEEHEKRDPFPKLFNTLMELGENKETLETIYKEAEEYIAEEFAKAVAAPDPEPQSVYEHEFAPTPIVEEKGEREPKGKEPIVMVDAALFACDEIMKKHPESLLYGQDVGQRLGGVFREAATLGQKHGEARVFNTPIQEAYIVGSTVGMSAVGLKPIVEIQFADYIWPAVNQLVEELSKSCYLSMGKYPVSSIIRIPTGAYGGGGPYHSGTVESSILPIKGIKVIYPSNAADMKGLLKAAYYDPNPVVVFEHKGLYWSKVPGTNAAKTPEPSEDYVIPLGKGRVVLEANSENVMNGDSVAVITYGMGVHWALNAAKRLEKKVEIIDLRSLNPLDEDLIYNTIKKHGKALVLTEETQRNSFAEAIAGRASEHCFQFLDAPIKVMGAANLPAVAMNKILEAEMLPNADKVYDTLSDLLAY